MCGASSTTVGSSFTRAPTRARDQSYFLYGTTREQLDFLRFPLGDLPKDEVRRIAAEVGLEVATKPDSQDICFVPDGDYAGLVKRLRPETEAPGEIVDLDGRVLGRHRGVVHFTVGQRRGIEIGGQKEPLYVVRIEPDEARIVVGPRRALAVAAMRVADWNWLGEDQREVASKVRSLAPPVPQCATATGSASTRLRIWRCARPGGGALRRHAVARRRLDRRDRSGASSVDGCRRRLAPASCCSGSAAAWSRCC